MYASVFVYTTASVTSATPRADKRFSRSTAVVANSPARLKRGNEIQRCWRLYEFYGHASSGPDESDTSRIVYLVRLISIWYYIANGSCFS